MESLFEKKIYHNSVYLHVAEYLNLSDIKNIYFLNKKIYKNINNKSCINTLIKNKSIKIIIKFMKKYLERCYYISNFNFNDYLLMDKNTILQKILAFYYFKYYDKRFIDLWYNFNSDTNSKVYIIGKYKIEKKNNPTRFDLYYLIKKMSIDDVFFVGW